MSQSQIEDNIRRPSSNMKMNTQTLTGCCCIVLVTAFLTTPAMSDSCPGRCTCFSNTEVYCNRTGISEIPSGIPSNTSLLDLSGNKINTVSVTSLAGLNNLSSLDLSINRLGLKSIQKAALNLPKLQDVDLSFNLFVAVPQELPKNITVFRLIQNIVTILKADSFTNYPNITYLDLSNNKIFMIEEHALDPLVHLDTIYLSFNKIHNVGLPANAFDKNMKMTSLFLRFNFLEHPIGNLPISVQNLDLVGNKIKVIPAYAFKNVSNLQTLAFWEGEVTVIEDNAFYGLNMLTYLDLQEEKITSSLTNNTFNGLTSLSILYINENNISSIESGAFHHFGQISSLWLGGNKLSTLQPGVLDTDAMPHLSEVYIYFNPWYCDCHLRWLREKVNNASYVIQDPHLIKCNGPPSVAGKAWDELQPSDFVC